MSSRLGTKPRGVCVVENPAEETQLLLPPTRLATAIAVFFVGVLVPLLGGYGSAVLAFSLTYVVGFALTLFGPETRVAPKPVVAESVPAVEPA
jgi:hypothetical protein